MLCYYGIIKSQMINANYIFLNYKFDSYSMATEPVEKKVETQKEN